MSKEVYCKQCVLTKPGDQPNSITKLVSWIPEKKAVEGKQFTIDDGEEIWTVSEVGSARITLNALKERERIYRRYRQVTDV